MNRQSEVIQVISPQNGYIFDFIWHAYIFDRRKCISQNPAMTPSAMQSAPNRCSVCPCPQPTERGPVLVMCLLNKSPEMTTEEQTTAFKLELETVLMDVGKLPGSIFSVVGVDSNEEEIVVEVVIDACDKQSSRAIFDTIDKLFPVVDEQIKVDNVPADDIQTSQDATEPEAQSNTAATVKNHDDSKKDAIACQVKIDSIRNRNACTKNIITILNGPCQHLLCLEAKKIRATVAEKLAISDAKQAEVQVFCESIDYKTCSRSLEDAQVDFCTAELSLRRSEEPDESTDAELTEMCHWQQRLVQTTKALEIASSVFQKVEDARLTLVLEAAQSKAITQFEQSKAERAFKICGSQCPSFTSYIELESFYTAQLEQDANNQMQAFQTPSNMVVYYTSDYGEPSTPSRIVYTSNLFVSTPVATTTTMLRGNTISPSTEPAKIFDADTETKNLFLYSTRDESTASATTNVTSEGFQQGNSISIPSNADVRPVSPLLLPDGAEKSEGAEVVKAEAVQAC